ncbi:peptidoglycan DD-metalloendopeptidase family protein [Alysiella filiformis]|uniref:Lipoprotein NlpD n=1 Tax=Alysiella filiformis DSM 16848 TaxID=1120981 RepID=A0A286E2J5_9NEIS|nr:peptidoglycan DD-metalloendopeptidase family protein [Alysiella filiformis]QMT30913.1 peptidoglycan DD-metalloendopeptidase family protein [Alysiella filiformis]UBQ56101.1 peptidoglycan DD-metalloendopeptidase family protein [Alysiella filiformis DSM 16848]SOD65115.1 lipoprotein NlpD [Alysiella filiformis DSM 16848]
MFKQWNARLLAISAALALSACAAQQAAAPVNTGTGAYNQVTGALNTGINDVNNAVNGAIAGNPYGTTYTPSAPATYTPPPAPYVPTAAVGNGQYGRVGGQYVPNYSPVDTSAATHIVQAGDTVYNIAKRYGISQDTLRSLNGLSGNTISIGQTLRVKSGSGKTVGNTTPVTVPTAPVVNAVTAPVVPTAPVPTATAPVVTPPPAVTTTQTATTSAPVVAVAPTPTAPVVTPPAANNTPTTKPNTDSFLPTQNVANITWQAPTAGKIARSFGGDNKGVDIAGTRGQDVVAAAAGQVVYSGSGLRGYGNLVIIQHTPAYLTAYGHNDSLLVREGESVKRGQVIAKMGQTDSSNGVKLHFEVRENGTPVDPSRFVKF